MVLEIVDETLRDGEQQVGIVFTTREKAELARMIADLGVHYIDVMPATSLEEQGVVLQLIQEGINLVPATMMSRAYVDMSRHLGATAITLFTSTSERLLKAKGKTPEQNIIESKEAVEYARQQGLTIDFAVEDATRTDIEYLAEFAHAMGDIRYLLVCDTVGVLERGEAGPLIAEIKQRYPGKIGVHFHNDRGLAVDNTIDAVLAGAELISGTFTGIGERAGNTNLEETLRKLRSLQIEIDGFDYDGMQRVCEKVREYAGTGPAKPGSPEALRTQTGIHVHAMLTDPKVYCSYPTDTPEVWFGKYSGVSNYRWLFEKVKGMSLPHAKYAFMRDCIKALVTRKDDHDQTKDRSDLEERKINRRPRSYSGDQIIDIFKQMFGNPGTSTTKIITLMPGY